VIYVPPPFAAGAIDEAVDAGVDLVICITEGVPVRDMIATRNRMRGKFDAAGRAELSGRHHAG
jgi:succinyl-CoA synthetase alpha subunit